MDRLEAMQVFVAVAEEASFAAAARKLALTPASVTRAVAALEERLGARLFHRTSRVVRISDAGATFLAQCKRILADVDEAEEQAASAHGALSGQLSVTAPVLFGRLCVAPVLLAFLKRHPRVSGRALFLDHVVDLLEQNVDVAVRIAPLPPSALRAIRVGTVRRVICASPGYLRARGTPTRPRDLAEHALIAVSGLPEPSIWRFQVDGKPENFHPRPRLSVNTGDVAIAAALEGHGMTRVLSYQVEKYVREKRLRIVLEECEVPPVPVHVLHVEGRRAAARVRAFVDFAVDELRAILAPRAS